MAGMARTTPVRPQLSAPRAGAVARGLLREARPRQWVKNLLLLAAPGAAGALTDAPTLGRALAGVAVFCLAASGVYYVNDALDAEADRLHPVKRHRPIAAGVISVRAGLAIGAALLAAAPLLAVVIGPWPFAAAVLLYVAVTAAYSLRAKHIAILDIVTVAAGFVIRAVAGGLVTGVPLTEWFLLVTTFGALFVVTGKRQAEVAVLGGERLRHRATLDSYTPELTQHLLTITSGATIVTYCLWAFAAQDDGGLLAPWPLLSVVPFVVVMFRYALLVYAGRGGEPEDLVLHDRQLQLGAVVWVALLALGIYL